MSDILIQTAIVLISNELKIPHLFQQHRLYDSARTQGEFMKYLAGLFVTRGMFPLGLGPGLRVRARG